MNASYCCMRTALDQLRDDDSLLQTAREQLATAVNHAKKYDLLLNSLYWKTAKPSVKRRVRADLDRLAFDAYSAFLDAGKTLNYYADSQAQQIPPRWWNTVICNLTLANTAFLREHRFAIDHKQLTLFH